MKFLLVSNTVVMRIEDMITEDEYDNIDTSKKSFPSLLLVIMHENNKNNAIFIFNIHKLHVDQT